MNKDFSTQIDDQRAVLESYDGALLEAMYRDMRLIREFEQTAAELSDAGEIPGPIHLYTGQEAVAVGACTALRDDDIIGSTHRGHGHVLAKGADIEAMLAELLGKKTGLNQGRGGSMHLVDFSLGIFGCNAIVGASVPHVAGGILSARLNPNDDRVGLAFFGDGAVNEGVVMETMNIASIWDLPVIFCCENNQYAVSTPNNEAIAGERISDRASSVNIHGETVNGQDVLAVYDAVSEAVQGARSDARPRFIECETYRYSGHFSGEAALLADRPYRDEDEIETWQDHRDPIMTFRAALVREEVFDEAALTHIDERVEHVIEQARTTALASELPAAGAAYDNVYADQSYPGFPAGKYQ